MFVISVCGSIWVSIVNVDVVGQCIYCCCYRCEHGFVSLDMRTKMLMHLFVVLAYADNDSKTVLLHLIRGPMTEMAVWGSAFTVSPTLMHMPNSASVNDEVCQ